RLCEPCGPLPAERLSVPRIRHGGRATASAASSAVRFVCRERITRLTEPCHTILTQPGHGCRPEAEEHGGSSACPGPREYRRIRLCEKGLGMPHLNPPRRFRVGTRTA